MYVFKIIANGSIICIITLSKLICTFKIATPPLQAFDVIVVGGGHAGTEAATAAARIGAKTLLITPKLSSIGELSCNPSIGGIGKGNLVCEIDALDGIMGKCADLSAISFRCLNRSKGPAVVGPRAQIDRDLYKLHIRKLLKDYRNLWFLEGLVEDVILGPSSEGSSGTSSVTNGNDVKDEGSDSSEEKLKVNGVKLKDGKLISSKTVILTTGTFLRGRCHISKKTNQGGRIDRITGEFESSSEGLANVFNKLKITTKRFKTGYEEAGALGIIAGINAGLKSLNRDEHFILNRDEGYLGILIDDLVRKGINEPYRMFTSRSEYRLQNRVDNGDLRMLIKGVKHGVLKDRRRIELMKVKYRKSIELISLLKSLSSSRSYWGLKDDIQGRTAWDMLKAGKRYEEIKEQVEELLKNIKENEFEEFYRKYEKYQREELPLSNLETKAINYLFTINTDNIDSNNSNIDKKEELVESIVEKLDDNKVDLKISGTCRVAKTHELIELINSLNKHIIAFVEAQAKYSSFVRRYRSQYHRAATGRKIYIHPDIKYNRDNFKFMSHEEIEILTKKRPETIQEAMELPGVTPATVVHLMNYMIRSR
ncbi:glucose-inhibited division protein a-like protein [Theileria orientalis]|uniref:Glucose-inhibited division protein a-like protein n=1 Tax=Theileria orientalis TaxID=68886 RepID=A0A976MD44_THEOR|nr:glucose-inhibited division protein a-like protein [Theileria orientalis]